MKTTFSSGLRDKKNKPLYRKENKKLTEYYILFRRVDRYLERKGGVARKSSGSRGGNAGHGRQSAERRDRRPQMKQREAKRVGMVEETGC